jgi:hypothetical protein
METQKVSEGEREIGAQRAELQKLNEMQRRAEINDALARMQQQAQLAAQIRSQAAGFDYGEFQRQQGFRERQEVGQQAALGRTVMTGLTAAAGAAGALPGLDPGLGGLVGGAAYGFQGKMPSGFGLTAAGIPVSPGGTAGTSGMVKIGNKDYNIEDIIAALS